MAWASKKTMEDNPYGRRLRKGWQSVVVTDVRKVPIKDNDGRATDNGYVVIECENEWEEKGALFLSDDSRDYPKIRALMDIYPELDFPDNATFSEVFDKFKSTLLTERREALDVLIEYSKGDRVIFKKIKGEGKGGDEDEEESEEIGTYEPPETAPVEAKPVEGGAGKKSAPEPKQVAKTAKKTSLRDKIGNF